MNSDLSNMTADELTAEFARYVRVRDDAKEMLKAINEERFRRHRAEMDLIREEADL